MKQGKCRIRTEIWLLTDAVDCVVKTLPYYDFQIEANFSEFVIYKICFFNSLISVTSESVIRETTMDIESYYKSGQLECWTSNLNENPEESAGPFGRRPDVVR